MDTGDQDQLQPIIIKKINKVHGGHHGGAWKVAFADFMTAMMAFFLVLWLVGQDEEVKEAVAGYFQDPIGFMSGGKIGAGKGSGLMTGEASVLSKTAASSIVKKMLEDAGKKILNNLQLSDDFNSLMENIMIEMTPEGLRIQIVEGADSSFFEANSSRMLPTGEAILYLVAEEIRALPNRLIFEGHTDASGSTNQFGYSNWDLGADRANFCRKVMLKAGVPSQRVKEIRSFADTQPLDPINPTDPRNRRVSILVLNDFDYIYENKLMDLSQQVEAETESDAYSMFSTDKENKSDDGSHPADSTAAGSHLKADSSSKDSHGSADNDGIKDEDFDVPAYLLEDGSE